MPGSAMVSLEGTYCTNKNNYVILHPVQILLKLQAVTKIHLIEQFCNLMTKLTTNWH